MLTDSEIKKAIFDGHFISTDAAGNRKPVAQALDGDNLWLEISDSKTGCWRFRFNRLATGRPSRMSLGLYPATSLKLARGKANDARALLAAGKDPITEREKERAAARAARSFEEVIKEWFAAFRENDLSRSKSTRAADERARDQLIDLFGKQLIGAITTPMVQNALLKVANGDGHKAKARTLRAILGEVFMYAIAKREAHHNPAAPALFKLPKIVAKPLAALISPGQVGELMRRIRGYKGGTRTVAALEVLARTFPRPANVAAMAWDEIDGNVWTIPAAKMKMRRGHRIHLSRQVLAILAELRETATGPFVFTNGNKPLSTKTLNRALRVLGYSSDVMVAHGFRSTASTLLNAECRWPKDIIEIQLAHGDEDRIRATYNRLSEFDAIMSQNADDKIVDRLWEIRVKMMQHWSDQLDALAGQTGVVVQLRKVA